MLEDKLLESIAATCAAHAAETDRGTFPTKNLEALAAAGLLGLVSAAEVGGKGLGLPAAVQVVERIARECGSTAKTPRAMPLVFLTGCVVERGQKEMSW